MAYFSGLTFATLRGSISVKLIKTNQEMSISSIGHCELTTSSTKTVVSRDNNILVALNVKT